ncbi:hypothetical protein [Bacillus sp. MUM 13]|uniref:hypothetical protein n=1 Tax=Bacillus sp. MUM 13 TaxID=1678001 RepID=UPI0008F5C2A3|nr:hypothetical protein [Bacillus sp. MUM 13]OIK11506.1 hypothetical protein BIV59_11790 [Bacillus sp. MUM 13]
MKNKLMLLIFLPCFFLILSSCSPGQNSSAHSLPKYKDKIVLLSNESNYMSENAYYDALLEFISKHPAQSGKLKKLNFDNHKKDCKTLNIKEAPALVIISKNGKVLNRISGTNVTKQAIMKAIQKTL